MPYNEEAINSRFFPFFSKTSHENKNKIFQYEKLLLLFHEITHQPFSSYWLTSFTITKHTNLKWSKISPRFLTICLCTSPSLRPSFILWFPSPLSFSCTWGDYILCFFDLCHKLSTNVSSIFLVILFIYFFIFFTMSSFFISCDDLSLTIKIINVDIFMRTYYMFLLDPSPIIVYHSHSLTHSLTLLTPFVESWVMWPWRLGDILSQRHIVPPAFFGRQIVPDDKMSNFLLATKCPTSRYAQNLLKICPIYVW